MEQRSSETETNRNPAQLPRGTIHSGGTAHVWRQFTGHLQRSCLHASESDNPTWKPYRTSLRLRKSQSGSIESPYHPKTRVASFITCLAPPERHRKRIYSPNRKNVYVDGKHNRPSIASFGRKTICQSRGRNFRPDNSRRMELRSIVRQPRRCRYKRTTSQRPPETRISFQLSN